MTNIKWLALLAAGTCFACATGTGAPAQTLAAGAGCQQLSTSDQTVQDLYTPGSIYAAKPLKRQPHLRRPYKPRETMGASLYTRAEPGMSEAYMERALRCYAAYGSATHPNDPLHPANGHVKDVSVKAVDGSFAIRIQGDSARTGREIWQRARSLSGQSTSIQTEQLGAAETQHSNL